MNRHRRRRRQGKRPGGRNPTQGANPRAFEVRPRYWPKESKGICTAEGISCALCQRDQRFSHPYANSHLARNDARRNGWTYMEPFGWVCGCRHQYQGVLQMEKEAGRVADPNVKNKGPSRIQISLDIK